jgi:hypothetical protein
MDLADKEELGNDKKRGHLINIAVAQMLECVNCSEISAF